VLAKTDRSARYALRKMPKHKTLKIHLHRAIMERMIGRELTRADEVDHINLNGLDNRRDNLRLATNSQNNMNVRRYRNNKSGFKGVHLAKGRWRASIRLNYKLYHLGYFDTPEEAYGAYCEAAKERFGEFARFD
jgi:hypothetical protein